MLCAEDFKKLYKQERDTRLKIRYLALYHFKKGKSRTQISQYLGVARGSVNTWVSNFLSYGADGLVSKKSTGRPSKLTEEERQKVSQFVQRHAVQPSGGRLIAEDVCQYIEDNFCVSYTTRNVYKLLHALGFSWITSRSKHPKQQPDVQEAFKKLPSGNDPSRSISHSS